MILHLNVQTVMFLRILYCARANWTQILWTQLLQHFWLDWVEMLWVCFLGYLFVQYLFIFSVTAPKRLHHLNSKFVIATTSRPYNRFSLNFRVFYLVCLIVPYLFIYCKTAPKQLNQLNSNLLQLLLLNRSTKWADINTTDNYWLCHCWETICMNS